MLNQMYICKTRYLTREIRVCMTLETIKSLRKMADCYLQENCTNKLFD